MMENGSGFSGGERAGKKGGRKRHASDSTVGEDDNG